MVVAVLVIAPSGWGATTSQTLDAIRRVETSDAVHPEPGDHGASIGPYQIKREYFNDARPFLSKADQKRPYGAVMEVGFARRVVVAYWKRYCPRALGQANVRVLSGTHNGGPAGGHRKRTLGYTKRVVKALSSNGSHKVHTVNPRVKRLGTRSHSRHRRR